MKVQRADWVTPTGAPSFCGVVKRVARDGTWADVNWRTHTKRMQTKHLKVQTTIAIGGIEVTDMTRESELNK